MWLEVMSGDLVLADVSAAVASVGVDGVGGDGGAAAGVGGDRLRAGGAGVRGVAGGAGPAMSDSAVELWLPSTVGPPKPLADLALKAIRLCTGDYELAHKLADAALERGA